MTSGRTPELKTIAIVLPDLTAIGAQRYVIGIARRLKERGFRTHYLLQAEAGKFLEDVPPHERQSFGYKIFRRIRIVRAIESLIRLFLHLRREQYDFVFSVTPFLNRVV